jgi:hypothetical protein
MPKGSARIRRRERDSTNYEKTNFPLRRSPSAAERKFCVAAKQQSQNWRDIMSDHENEYEDDLAEFNEETEPESTLPATMAPPLTPAKLANLKKLAEETSINQLGTLTKFNKGKWLVGDDEVTGQRRVAHVDKLMRGRIKFRDGKVVDRRVGKVVDGFQIPPRNELDDTNEDAWEKDAAGNRIDPWVMQYFLPLHDPETNAVTTYVTNSVGGIAAIGALVNEFTDNTQNGLPVIRLATSSYKHKIYGRVETPDLQVVGWTGKPTLAAALDEEIPF